MSRMEAEAKNLVARNRQYEIPTIFRLNSKPLSFANRNHVVNYHQEPVVVIVNQAHATVDTVR